MEYNPSLTPTYLAGKVDEYVKFAARDTVARNARRDPKCRMARLPDGNACDFCRMLGSRGFVYHSEFKAGGDGNEYHPHCNCQIAVCFDPFISKYDVVSESGTITTVTRGYGDGELARPGRDGSYELREVDMDALYDEYKESARKFTAKSKLKDYTRGARLSEDEFEDAMRRLEGARTLDELHEVGADIVDGWAPNDNGRDKAQWDELSRRAKELEKGLKENGCQPLRMTGKETYSYYATDEERVRDWMRGVTMAPQKKYSGPSIANKTRADMQTRDDISILEPMLKQAESRGLITYGKEIVKFTADPSEGRDLFVHAAIVRDGRQIEVLQEIQQNGRKNIDTIIDGKRVEIKCPISDGKSKHPLGFVKDNFYTAVDQFKKDTDANEREVRLLYCTRYTPIDDGLIIAELEKFKSKDYVASIEVLRKDGTFYRVK